MNLYAGCPADVNSKAINIPNNITNIPNNLGIIGNTNVDLTPLIAFEASRIKAIERRILLCRPCSVTVSAIRASNNRTDNINQNVEFLV